MASKGTKMEEPLGPLLLGGEVLARVARQRQTCVLDWHTTKAAHRLVLKEGRPMAVSLGGAKLTPDKASVQRLLRGLAVSTDGRCVINVRDIGGNTGLQIDTLGEVMIALLKHLKPAQLDSIWQARGHYVAHPTPAFERLAIAIGQQGVPTLSQPLSGTEVSDLVRGADGSAQRAWVAVMVLGGLSVAPPAPKPKITTPEEAVESEAEEDEPEEDPTAAVAPKEIPEALQPGEEYAAVKAPIPANRDAREIWVDIEKSYKALLGQSHFEVLGIDEKATAEDVRHAYFAMAKKWHLDQFSGLGLSDISVAKAEELFRSAEEANRVLSDPDTRSNYMYIRDRLARGLPTDPEVIMEAESLFVKAQTLVRRGQGDQALGLLEEAVRLNKGEAEFWIYLGYARFCVGGEEVVDQAVEEINQGIEMNKNLDSAHEFLGRIARVQNRMESAREHLEKALHINPKNIDAKRELRLLTVRSTGRFKPPGKKGGLLGGLFKK